MKNNNGFQRSPIFDIEGNNVISLIIFNYIDLRTSVAEQKLGKVFGVYIHPLKGIVYPDNVCIQGSRKFSRYQEFLREDRHSGLEKLLKYYKLIVPFIVFAQFDIRLLQYDQ